MISVTPNVPFRIVPEGDSGLFNFTVTNVGTEPVTLTVFSPLLNVPVGDPAFGNTNPIVNGVEFVSGDRNDEVLRTTIPNGEDFCGGFRLGPQGTCVFKQLFDTRDLNKPQSDTNSGIWKIYNFVSFTPAAPPTFKIGSAMVEVLDPGATSQLPEPSALLLFASGLAGLAGLRRS